MPKLVKSQWDFGELFPPESPGAPRKILSVTELTGQIRRLLEKQVGVIWVMGEITNLKIQNSGHIYFTLKDAGAQLSCILFRGELQVDRALLQDGRKITVQGELTVYEPRGQYQLRVLSVELQGIGALQVAFEKLKQKLNAEGLFAPERKRPPPRYPQRIGLVTSPTGAAIRDVLHVIRRRNPGLEIIFVPCRVQGDGAAEEIAAAIRLLNEFVHAVEPLNRSSVQASAGSTIQPLNDSTRLDLILLTRGGGSLEDLWAFNEEVVARAIFESAIPVVSAVGHEIDFTISDFVADARAATPSAAAEIITEGVFASRQFVTEAPGWMTQRIHRRLEREAENFSQWRQRLTRLHPRRRLNEKLQLLDDLQTGLWRSVKQRCREFHVRWQNSHQRLLRVRAAQLLERGRQNLRDLVRRLREQISQRLNRLRNRFDTLEARRRLLSPVSVLERGYSITSDAATGKVIRDAAEVSQGQALKTRLKNGQIRSVVSE